MLWARIVCAFRGHIDRPVWCEEEKRVRIVCTRCYEELLYLREMMRDGER